MQMTYILNIVYKRKFEIVVVYRAKMCLAFKISHCIVFLLSLAIRTTTRKSCMTLIHIYTSASLVTRLQLK